MKKFGENVVGYSISVHGNGTRMFVREDKTVVRCPHCQHRAKQSVHNPAYRVARVPPAVCLGFSNGESLPILDLAVTHDAEMIASKAFRAFCDLNRYHGIKFEAFANDERFFHVTIVPVVEFDAERRRTRFLKKCEVCGEFEEIIGATPAFVRSSHPLPCGFSKTVPSFGTLDGKGPIILIGPETKAQLQATFNHISFKEVYGQE